MTVWFLQHRAASARAALAAAAVALAGCGGSSGIDNPPPVQNPLVTGGQSLSFVYYQRCIQPIFTTPLTINQNGVTSVNTCASAGCHDNATGTGGAFRVIANAQPVNVATTATDVIRASDMYKNFFSAKAASIIGQPLQSRLLTKPLVLNVLHGGGSIFASDQDPNALRIRYWISRPVPLGQDEFSGAANSMFTPPDPVTGACNTQ
jgi:hypothetical protein